MSGVIFGFFAISILLFLGMINYLLLSQKVGVYPPKRVLRQKALTFGGTGIVALIIAILLLYV